ncbi:hypothetical protein STRIP9103_00710 [Streptomyces ipomoeae 91-03]|uniref:Uncharacterized protein n=1 Tax=Streptomyces ipomoeae 91-03 TaxID=698759 RepID=L1KX25_9ACTN|nr:hypothetical protein STRIP9103_00710 [Streptomyces ipomoeae 91-03]
MAPGKCPQEVFGGRTRPVGEDAVRPPGVDSPEGDERCHL